MAEENAEKRNKLTPPLTEEEWDRVIAEGWEKFMTFDQYIEEKGRQVKEFLLGIIAEVEEEKRKDDRKHRIRTLTRENHQLRKDYTEVASALATVREMMAIERQVLAEGRQERYARIEKEVREKIEKERSLGNRLRRAVSHVKGLIIRRGL